MTDVSHDGDYLANHLTADNASTVSSLKSWIAKLSKAIAKQRKIRADRAEIKEMMNFSDSHLADIGLKRSDVYWALKLPMDQIASLELQDIARANRLRHKSLK